MGLRFRKSIKIAPGVKVNLNKKSTSVTFGGKGVHHTVSSTGRKTTSVGIPGTGLYYTETTSGKRKQHAPVKPTHSDAAAVQKSTSKNSSSYAKPKKKHRVLKTMLVLFVVLITIGMLMPDADIESIKLETINAPVDVNSNIPLTVTLNPKGASSSGIELISSDKQILTASMESDQVVISSHDVGTAYLYAVAENGVKSNKVQVKVINELAERKKAQERKEKQRQAAIEKQEREAATAAKQRQTEAKSPSQEYKEGYVYVSRTGSKYHSNASCSNMNSPSYVPLSEAKQVGLDPCKKCY